ncbi:MAG: hypothetical protein JO028_13245, partial [Acidobacteriaceae bacterium]|nr:hypothetical protein [Acidobacteriaceae bacterium]
MAVRICRFVAFAAFAVSIGFGEKGPKQPKEPVKPALEQYVEDAHRTAVEASAENPGSLLAGPV